MFNENNGRKTAQNGTQQGVMAKEDSYTEFNAKFGNETLHFAGKSELENYFLQTQIKQFQQTLIKARQNISKRRGNTEEKVSKMIGEKMKSFATSKGLTEEAFTELTNKINQHVKWEIEKIKEQISKEEEPENCSTFDEFWEKNNLSKNFVGKNNVRKEEIFKMMMKEINNVARVKVSDKLELGVLSAEIIKTTYEEMFNNTKEMEAIIAERDFIKNMSNNLNGETSETKNEEGFLEQSSFGSDTKAPAAQSKSLSSFFWDFFQGLFSSLNFFGLQGFLSSLNFFGLTPQIKNTEENLQNRDAPQVGVAEKSGAEVDFNSLSDSPSNSRLNDKSGDKLSSGNTSPSPLINERGGFVRN